MFYKSEMPDVVGEFDARLLHEQIGAIEAKLPGVTPYQIVKILGENKGIRYPLMSEIVPISWLDRFDPEAFESDTNDGQVDQLFFIRPGWYKGERSERWHADYTSSNRIFRYPDIITGASRWPTAFLVGRIPVPMKHAFTMAAFDFWNTELGSELIETATFKGDAEIVHFEPGQIVKVKRGTLHRVDIPEDANGTRYFVRKFPKRHVLHAGHPLGRLSLY